MDRNFLESTYDEFYIVDKKDESIKWKYYKDKADYSSGLYEDDLGQVSRGRYDLDKIRAMTNPMNVISGGDQKNSEFKDKVL